MAIGFMLGAGDIGAILNQMIPGETRFQDRLKDVRDQNEDRTIDHQQNRNMKLDHQIEASKGGVNAGDLDSFATSQLRKVAVSNVAAAKSGMMGDRMSLDGGTAAGNTVA